MPDPTPSTSTPSLAEAPDAILAETGRLRIRRLGLEDAPWILRLLNEPSFIDNIADKGVRTLEQARDYLASGPLQSYRVHGHGLNRVELLATGAPIGMCGLLKRDQFDHPDLGYALFPQHAGMGHATEACAAVLAHGERRLGCTRVLAIVTPGNARSIRVLAKLGFASAGRVALQPSGEPVDLYERHSPASAP